MPFLMAGQCFKIFVDLSFYFGGRLIYPKLSTTKYSDTTKTKTVRRGRGLRRTKVVAQGQSSGSAARIHGTNQLSRNQKKT